MANDQVPPNSNLVTPTAGSGASMPVELQATGAAMLTVPFGPMLRGADLLDEVEFDGPVPDIIRQAQENVDGTGRPAQLKGEDILVGARVLAVANAFVAMVRPRSYRKEGLTFEKAADELGVQAGKMFDRKAVFALLNVLENREGRQHWKRFDVADAAQ